MPRDAWIWCGAIFVLATALSVHGSLTGAGSQYVRREPILGKAAVADGPREAVDVRFVSVNPGQAGQPGVEFSPVRTAGTWLAGLLILSALSFLWGDNVIFRLMQSLLVGVSAGYAAVTGFWTAVIPRLLGKLWPAAGQTFLPGLDPQAGPEYLFLVPLGLGVLLLWRLSPVGGWISRWPLAFLVGLMAGLNLAPIIKTELIGQVQNTILPLAVLAQGRFDPWASLKNLLILAGVLAALTYFIFSVERKGAIKGIARTGVLVLMITFGASFAMTVMTRVTIMSGQLVYVFDDWLWLIDPQARR